MANKYDSAEDTLKHIKRVNELLLHAIGELSERAIVHDSSKLEEPEKTLFDEFTPMLKDCTYGSAEYKEFLKQLDPALQHHYSKNSHHPEHYPGGVDEMDLFDIMEMFFDWKAASERHTDGNILKSIDINKKRFKMSDQLAKIFNNTAQRLPKSV